MRAVVTVAECVREGIANAVASAIRTWIVAVLAALAIGGAVAADLASARTIIDAQRDAIAAGANLLVADGTFAAQRCTSLSTQHGVEAVAAFARSADPPVDPIGGLPVPIIAATSGFGDLVAVRGGLGPVLNGTFVVDDDFAVSRDLSPGRVVSLDTGSGHTTLRAAAVIDLSRLGAEFSSGIVVGLPESATATHCIVETTPGAADVVGATLAAATSTPAVQSEVRRVHPDLERDYLDEYNERPSRFLPLGSGVVVGIGLFGLVALRRSDRGLYRSLGVSRTALALIAFVETTAALTFASGTALATAAAVTELAPIAAWARAISTSAAVAAIVSVVLHVVLRERSILALVKDR